MDLLSFNKLAKGSLDIAIRALTIDPNNMTYLVQVVGMLVGAMAIETGHRKCVFVAMKPDDVLGAQEYKSTFVIKVSCLFINVKSFEVELQES